MSSGQLNHTLTTLESIKQHLRGARDGIASLRFSPGGIEALRDDDEFQTALSDMLNVASVVTPPNDTNQRLLNLEAAVEELKASSFTRDREVFQDGKDDFDAGRLALTAAVGSLQGVSDSGQATNRPDAGSVLKLDAVERILSQDISFSLHSPFDIEKDALLSSWKEKISSFNDRNLDNRVQLQTNEGAITAIGLLRVERGFSIMQRIREELSAGQPWLRIGLKAQYFVVFTDAVGHHKATRGVPVIGVEGPSLAQDCYERILRLPGAEKLRAILVPPTAYALPRSNKKWTTPLFWDWKTPKGHTIAVQTIDKASALSFTESLPGHAVTFVDPTSRISRVVRVSVGCIDDHST